MIKKIEKKSERNKQDRSEIIGEIEWILYVIGVDRNKKRKKNIKGLKYLFRLCKMTKFYFIPIKKFCL